MGRYLADEALGADNASKCSLSWSAMAMKMCGDFANTGQQLLSSILSQVGTWLSSVTSIDTKKASLSSDVDSFLQKTPPIDPSTASHLTRKLGVAL